MKKRVSKFYIFYITDDSISGYNTGDIYAYTCDIECARNFMCIRDMDKFYTKEIKLTHDELNMLYTNYTNSQLSMFSINGCNNETYNTIIIDIALTFKEHRECQNLIYMRTGVDLYASAIYNPFIFHKKYTLALTKLMFTYAFLYMTNPSTIVDSKNRIFPNEFNGVIDSIGHTLSEKYRRREAW